MAHYVDGFVIPRPKKHLNACRRLAQKRHDEYLSPVKQKE